VSISSRISSSIKRRRRLSFYKKALYCFIFVLFFISLFILLLTWKKVRIVDTKVNGNSSISTGSISDIVETGLNTKYLWFIPTDNWLLIRRSEIENQILNSYPRINSAKISFKNLNDIEVNVLDREPAYLWCNNSACYFVDKLGFIFDTAPDLKPNPYIELFGLITDNPVRKSYLPEKFSDISGFLSSLTNLKLNPISFTAIDGSEYEISLFDGGKIMLNDSTSFSKYVKNIQALIDNGYLKTDAASLKKLDYIDLRYGNKVPIKFK
jgi:cell division septal protein FtsQ